MNLHHHIKDPELRAKLTPNFSIGCKRILASDDYYPALVQPNVQVIASGLKEVSMLESLIKAVSAAAVSAEIYCTDGPCDLVTKSCSESRSPCLYSCCC